MQPNVVTFPDEAPTKKTRAFHSETIAFASRVDRLAEIAIERLQCAPDDESLELAVADLTQLRELAGAVLR